MIIILKNELIHYCELDSNNKDYDNFFELIAEIRKRNFHFVFGERQVLEKLSRKISLSSESKKIYHNIYSNYTSYKTIEKQLSFKFEIGTIDEINDMKIKLNINEFSENFGLSKNNLLIEDSDDSELYQRIIEFYKVKNNINIEYHWDIRNGGGTNAYKEFNRLTNEQTNFTFSILDSDKKYPFCHNGETSLKFIKSKLHNKKYGKFKILDVHEIENLIPAKIINSYVYSDRNQKRNRILISKFANNNTCDALLYLDLKNGISIESISKYSETGREYWNKKLKDNITHSRSTNIIVTPFGRDILKKIFKHISKLNLDINTFVTGKYDDIWTEIGRDLLDIYCRPHKII